MAITTTPLLGLPYAGADTDETYAVLAGLFVKDGQKLTLSEIVERYTPTIGSVYIKAADWTAADGTADAYDAKITISGVEQDSMILIYPATDGDAEKAKRLGIRAKAASGVAADDTFVIVRAAGGDPTVTEGINLVYIALRGYAVWSGGLTPPGLPYATVIGVDPYVATEEGTSNEVAISQKAVSDSLNAIRYAIIESFYTKEEVDEKVSAIQKVELFKVVTALPTENISTNTVYLVKGEGDEDNIYTEYIYANGAWEILGTQTLDLADYVTDAELEEAVNAALTAAKDSGEFDGRRGYSILRVSTSTTSSSGTGDNGAAIKYKIALSAVKSEAGVAEVLVGDTVLRASVYMYPVVKVDASYVYLGAYTSIKGNPGSPGDTPVRGTDYWTEEDQAAIVADVLAALPASEEVAV